MEYTNELAIFEGIVDAADDVISISEIVEKAGNERRMDYLLAHIQEFIKEVEYLEDGVYKKEVTNKLRQLALFVILSSDLPILEEIKKNQSLELLIGSLPTLPRYVMCEILWSLNIDSIISEILFNTHPMLAVEVTTSLIKNFKYFCPNDCLQRLHMLTTSCYKCINQIMFFKLDSKVLRLAYDNFLLCLKYILEPPNSHKLNTINEDELYKYMGDRIHTFLFILNDCFCVFTEKDSQTIQINEIYLSTIPADIIKHECLSLCDADKEPDIQVVKEYLVKCNTALQETSKSLLSDVSVDVFCSWSEFEENGKSLQNKIGDIAYKVTTNYHQFLNEIEHVWVILQLISAKPKDLKEHINEVDTKAIEEKLAEETDESVEWLKALVYRENLRHEESLLRIIYSRVNLLNSDESYQLYDNLYANLNNSEHRGSIKSLAIKCFQNCNSEIKQKLVDKHFDHVFNDSLTTDDLDSMITKIFNKLISLPEDDLSQLYDVFIQNPKCVFSKIFFLASENAQQTSIMVKVMIFLQKYSHYRYDNENESCVFMVTKATIDNNFETEAQENNIISFINQLKLHELLPELKLFNMIILPSIEFGIKDNDIIKINMHCKLLHKTYKPSEIVQYRAPMLSMMAQVLNSMRWKLNTFLAYKPNIIDTTINIVSAIFATYDSNIPEKDKEWLKTKLKDMNPLNMFYYRQLWIVPCKSFIETISGTCINEKTSQERVALWLSQQFCSTTLQEWSQMWNSLEQLFKDSKILDLFHTAVMIIVLTEKNHRTDQSEACMLYCLRNYMSCIRNKYLQPPLSDSKVLNAANKLTALENLVEASDVNNIKPIFLPILSYIAERKDDYTINISSSLFVKLKHEAIKDSSRHLYIIN